MQIPSNQYYISRPERPDVSVDPDGVQRDATSVQEKANYLQLVRREMDYIQALPPGTLLDHGCGSGRALEYLSWTTDHYLIGVEPNYSRARKAAQFAHVACCTLPEADASRELPYNVDYVISHHVIEHCSDPVTELRCIYRMLRTGGHLVIGTPDFDSPSAREHGERYRLLHDPTHISLFSRESLGRCLKDIGFRIENVDLPFPAYLDTEEAREKSFRANVSPPARGNVMTFYARKP